jgi:hypothetical protein
MFKNIATRWMAGATLSLTMASSLLGTGVASAATLTPTLTASGAASGSQNAVAPGTVISLSGTAYGDSEYIGFWINVPSGTLISNASLGQTDSYVDGTVIPLDAMAQTDAGGSFSYSFNTSGLPAGSYSLVAHGLDSRIDEVLPFTIAGSAVQTVQLTASGDTSVAAGTVLSLKGVSYGDSEPVGFWINVPSGTLISRASLGQTDSYVDGSVIPLDAMAQTDAAGTFTYSLDTTGLPSGSYSLVAHGLDSKIDQVLTFTIK